MTPMGTEIDSLIPFHKKNGTARSLSVDVNGCYVFGGEEGPLGQGVPHGYISPPRLSLDI